MNTYDHRPHGKNAQNRLPPEDDTKLVESSTDFISQQLPFRQAYARCCYVRRRKHVCTRSRRPVRPSGGLGISSIAASTPYT
eukprot:6201530-Pleurochrysis_carterae.AAC.1